MKAVRIILAILGFAFVVKASIRMVDDPKPKVIVYKLKDVGEGTVSFRTNEMDDGEYEVGDMIMMGDTSCHYVGNSQPVTVKSKYMVIAKSIKP